MLSNSRGDKRQRAADGKAEKLRKEGEKRKPMCLYPPHQEKGLRRYLKDCKQCPDADKERLLADLK